MKRLHQITLTAAFTALALSLIVSPTPLNAQPGQRGQSGNAEAAPPPPPPPGERGRGPADAQPVRRGPATEPGPRGPVDAKPVARGPMAYAPGMPGPGGPMAGLTGDVTRFWERPQAVERLALTPEQVEKLEASHDKARPAMDKSEARMREAGEALAKALHGDTEPDIAMLRATVEEFSAAQKELMMAGVEHRASMQSILTPEQLTSLREMRQPRMRGPMMEGSPGARREGGPRALPDLPAAAPGDAPAAAPEARGRAPRDGEGQQARPPRQRREAPPAPPAPPAAPPVTE